MTTTALFNRNLRHEIFLRSFHSAFSPIGTPQVSSALSLVLLAGLLVFSPLLEGGTTHQAVMIIRLIILVLLGVYVWNNLRSGQLSIPKLSIGPAVFAYLALAVVLTIVSPYTNQSLQWLLVLSSYAVLLWVIVTVLYEPSHLRKLVFVLIGMGLFEAALTLMQCWQGRVRPSGTFFNPNFLAGYVAAIGTVLLSALCYSRKPHSLQSVAAMLATALAAMVLMCALLFTGSRGGMLAALVGGTVVLALRYRWRALIGIGLILVALIAFPNPLRERIRIEHIGNPLAYARLHIWQSSAQVMLEHPFGVGLGLYQYIYPRYARALDGEIARYGTAAQTAHNEYLQMGVELGVLSILIFLWGMVGVAREVALSSRQRLRRGERAVLVGVTGGIVGILAHAAVDSNLHEPAIAVLLTVFVAMVLCIRRLPLQVAERDRIILLNHRKLWAGAVTAMLILVSISVLRFGFGWMAYEVASRAQDPHAAVSWYRTAIDLDPGKSLYHSGLASSYFRLYQRTAEEQSAEAAIAELKSAMALNRLDGRIPGLLGHVYFILASSISTADQRRRDFLLSAVSAYEQATALEPFSPFHRLALGQLRLALGDEGTAEAEGQRAITLEPNFLPAREWLVKLYIQSGRTTRAFREYEEIRQRQQQFRNYQKNTLEDRYLAVDAAGLGVMLQSVRPPT